MFTSSLRSGQRQWTKTHPKNRKERTRHTTPRICEMGFVKMSVCLCSWGWRTRTWSRCIRNRPAATGTTRPLLHLFIFLNLNFVCIMFISFCFPLCFTQREIEKKKKTIWIKKKLQSKRERVRGRRKEYEQNIMLFTQNPLQSCKQSGLMCATDPQST